MIWYIFINCN